ncbi:MarR family winged helix-turn-helix transcriptional regulator [Pusillimonas sp.]|uniref:MarR family winged helix-turn-helix transcriptional regulator n=1 Tax=Pusillimonas sp. TaxID=3040095 RepID=UPI0037CA8408
MKKSTHSAPKSSKLIETEGESKKSSATARTKKASAEPAWQADGLDLENYAPAYFTFVATKLASGAAAVYRKHFGVGIEIWRVLVMLALDEKVSVNMVCKLIGMDKGSVSRCFKSMYEKGFITFSHDPRDGRVRYATLTSAGRRKHDEIKAVALAREQAFLSCLKPQEAAVLIDMLHRLHANLPHVEKTTQQYLRQHVINPAHDK